MLSLAASFAVHHNSFDLFKQIPFDETSCLYDKALSPPIDFGLAPDEGEAAFDDTLLVNVKNMFRMSWLDVIRGSWLMLRTWAANRRTVEEYASLNAAHAWASAERYGLENLESILWSVDWLGLDERVAPHGGTVLP